MKNITPIILLCTFLCINIENSRVLCKAINRYKFQEGNEDYQDSGEYLRKRRFVVLNPEDIPSCNDAFCSKVGNGLNQPGFPCSNSYCNCANGRPHKQQCGSGLVFNRQFKNCDYPSNVLACKFRIG